MNENPAPSFWQRRLVQPILSQLKQGVTPDKLALSCVLGITLGIFPILGATTLLCFLAGIIFKLNQPVLQAINYLVYPIQLILFPVFLRAGEKLFGENPVSFSPVQLTREFSENPREFLAKYGMIGLHGIAAWSIVAIILIGALYPLSRLLFRKMAAQIRTKK